MTNKLKQITYKNSEVLIAAFVIGVFSLISLTWFDGDNVIGAGDNGRYVNLALLFKSMGSSWNSKINTGGLENYLMYHIPYSIYFVPLYNLGLSEVTTQKFFTFLSLFVPGFFMYLFLNAFIGNKVQNIIKISAALFYIFNPITMLLPLALNLPKLSIHVSLPIFSLLIVLIFRAKKIQKKLILTILLSLLTVLAAPAFVNIAEVAPLVIVVFFLFLYELSQSKEKKLHLGLFTLSITIGILINAWWITSSLLNTFVRREALVGALADFKTNARVFDAMRLFGFWALNSYNKKVPYYNFGSFYYTPTGIFITYLITIVVFSTMTTLVILRKRLSDDIVKKTLFMLLISFIGVFLVKGTREPLGFIYSYLHENFGFFRIFRESFSKFSLVSLFSFTVVICLNLYYISLLTSKFIKKSYIPISILFIILTILIARPMFNGELVNKWTYGPMKGLPTKVPEYWEEISEYSANYDFEERVLLLPKTSYYRKSFLWERGHVGMPANLFLNATTTWYMDKPITEGDIAVAKLYDEIEKYIEEPTEKSQIRILNLGRLLGIGYILQMNDFDWLSFSDHANWKGSNIDTTIKDLASYLEEPTKFGYLSEEYIRSIPHVAGGKLIYRFEGDPTTADYIEAFSERDALVLYKINSDYVIPIVYIPNVVMEAADIDSLLTELEGTNIKSDRPMFIKPGTNISRIPDETPNAEYKKISNTRYEVLLFSPVSQPTPIVFSETFDKEWILAENCNWLKCKELENYSHFKVNSFANGFVIDGQDAPLDSFYLVHESEFRLKVGILISAAALLTAISALSIFLYKQYSGSKRN